jgi:hypothetical protein
VRYEVKHSKKTDKKKKKKRKKERKKEKPRGCPILQRCPRQESTQLSFLPIGCQTRPHSSVWHWKFGPWDRPNSDTCERVDQKQGISIERERDRETEREREKERKMLN